MIAADYLYVAIPGAVILAALSLLGWYLKQRNRP